MTVFRACKRSDRRLIMNMYTAHILAAAENGGMWKVKDYIVDGRN